MQWRCDWTQTACSELNVRVQVWITNCNGRNETFVDDQLVEGRMQARHGTVITIKGRKFRFEAFGDEGVAMVGDDEVTVQIPAKVRAVLNVPISARTLAPVSCYVAEY
jgi:hypothetical protein